MVRGVVRTGSGRPVFSELQQNGEPPKSTLAAQLVDHLTDGKKHSRNQDQETFRQLLQEVLGTEDEEHFREESYETNSIVNYKLIYVIYKAGIEAVQSEDPFGQRVEVTRQLIDSLAAIKHTIRRNPEVLFVAPSNHETEAKFKGPLFLWLLPKLLNLTGYSLNVSIRDAVIQLLKTALVTETKAHIRGVKINTIVRYLKGCTKGQFMV